MAFRMGDQRAPSDASASSSTTPSDFELQIFEQVAVRMDSKTTAESLIKTNGWMKCVELLSELTFLMAKQPAIVGTTGCSSQSFQMPTTRSSQASSAQSSQMTSALVSATTGTKRARDKLQTPAKRKQPPSSPAIAPVVPEEVQDLNYALPPPSGPIDIVTRNLLVQHMLVRQDRQGTSEPGAGAAAPFSPSTSSTSGILSQYTQPRKSASPVRSGLARRTSARAVPVDTKCPDCPSKIATADHRQRHIAKGAFPCKSCTYSSDSERGTQRHEAIHKQERVVRTPSRSKARAPKEPIPRARDETPFAHLAAENAEGYELVAAVSNPPPSQPTRKSARNRNAPDRFSPIKPLEKIHKKGKVTEPLVSVRNTRFASCPAVPGRSILKSTSQRENVQSQNGTPKKVAFKETRTRFYTRGRSLGRRPFEEDDEVGPVCSPDRDPRTTKNGQTEMGTSPKVNENGSALGMANEGSSSAGSDESQASTNDARTVGPALEFDD